MLWFTFFNNKKEFCSELPFIIIIKNSDFLGGGGFQGHPPSVWSPVSNITSDVLEHKWRASLKLHNCYMIDFNF